MITHRMTCVDPADPRGYDSNIGPEKNAFGSPLFFRRHIFRADRDCSLPRARRAGCGTVAAASGRGGRHCSHVCSARRLRGRRTSRGPTTETGRTSSTIPSVSTRPSIPSCPSSPGARAWPRRTRTASAPWSPSTATRSQWVGRITLMAKSTGARCGCTRAIPPATARHRGRSSRSCAPRMAEPATISRGRWTWMGTRWW